MFLPSHTMKSKIFIEKYDINGKLIDEREVDTKNDSDAFIELEKKSPSGKIIESQKIPFRSFVRNYIGVLSGSLLNGNQATRFLRLDGSSIQSTVYSLHNASYNIPLSYDNAGILIGKNQGGYSQISADSASFSDFNLKNKISHGISSGTMWYGDSIYQSLRPSASYNINSNSRVFSNLTSQSINISEIGMSTAYASSINNTNTFLIARDIKDYNGNAININLVPNESLFIKYKFLINTSSLLPNYNWMKLIDWDSQSVNGGTYLNPVGFKNYISYRNSARTGSIKESNSDRMNALNELADFQGFSSTLHSAEINYLNGDKWLKLFRTGSSTKIHYSFWTPMSIQDTDITYLINSDNVTNYSIGFCTRYIDNNNVGFSVHTNSSSLVLLYNASTVITSSLGHTFDSGSDYYIRWITSGSSHKVKSWQSGSIEPGTWDIDTTHSFTGSGNIGFLSHNNIYTTPQNTYFNDLNITFTEFTQSHLGLGMQDTFYVHGGSSDYTSNIFAILSPATYEFSGIVIGKSDITGSNELIASNTFSHYDWRLNNQIPHGNTNNTIYYGTTTITSSFESTSSGYIEINRQFVNNASYTASIKEIGLYTNKSRFNSSVDYTAYTGMNICIGRVSTGVPLTLSNGESAIIRMKFYFYI